MADEIDHQISHISALLMSDDADSAIEGARQLRMLSIQNRFLILSRSLF